MSALDLPANAPTMLAPLVADIARGRVLRVVNFHATPRYREAEYRHQIAEYARWFEPVTRTNLASAINGSWTGARPAMMPVLFEGFRDNLDVMLPIIEEHGFTAWLFIPPAFLSTPAAAQREYAAAHVLHLPRHDEYPGERVALDWNEARAIAARGHVFACHTRSHFELKSDTPRAVLEDEIVRAKAEMEHKLGTEVDSFCWLRGAALGINPEADALLRSAGYRYLFSSFRVQAL